MTLAACYGGAVSDFEPGTGGSGGGGPAGNSGGSGGNTVNSGGTGGINPSEGCAATEAIEDAALPISLTASFSESEQFDLGECSFDMGIGSGLAWTAKAAGNYRVTVGAPVPVGLSAFELEGGACSVALACAVSTPTGAGGAAGAGGAGGAGAELHQVSLTLTNPEAVALVVSANATAEEVAGASYTLTISEE